MNELTEQILSLGIRVNDLEARLFNAERLLETLKSSRILIEEEMHDGLRQFISYLQNPKGEKIQ